MDGFGMLAGSGGGVGDPSSVGLGAPVGDEVGNGLLEVVGGRMDGRVLAGATERDVGEFAAAAGGEDVRPVTGGALRAVDGERVAVVEMLAVEGVAGQGCRSTRRGT